MTDATDPAAPSGGPEPDRRIGQDEARDLYENTTIPVAEIARRMRVTPNGFNALRRRQGWPMRRLDISFGLRAGWAWRKTGRALPAPPPQRMAVVPAVASPTETGSADQDVGAADRARATADSSMEALDPLAIPAVPTDPRALARMLRNIAAQESARLFAWQAAHPEVDPEATTRQLASLARTCKMLDTIEAEDKPDAPEAPGRSLAELRDELHRRLVRLRAERSAARRDRKLQQG